MEQSTHSFGYWLRRRRKALDLTQEELAQTVSCSRFAIRKIEADERRPSRRLAERLAEKLGIPESERAAFLDAARALRAAERLPLDRQPLLAAPAPAPEEAVRFVGRANEYGLLVALLARLTGGTGHVVLLEGEPGIGKSRLMRELAAYARGRGLWSLATRCYEIERAMPYQPVIDLVSQAVELAPPGLLRHLPPVSLAEIAALVPAVGERVPVPPLSSDFPEARRARLFRAVGQLLEALAGGRQLVILVDDVQWADDASVQFLHFLARHAARHPLLLLCAYRDEDVPADERLAGFVAALRREAHARYVPLARLQLADTQALLEGLGDAQLAARLHRETEGNPFFLTSMMQALREGGIGAAAQGALALPDALREAVRARLAHVPPEARPTLDVAAVLGRHFDFDTLLAVAREPEERLLQALETLVKRRLLREAETGDYDFTHDKLREVAYRDIGAARRMLLHRAVAEALERAGEGAARLALHYEGGHVWDKALANMRLAAERSARLFALRDALHWLDRAVAIAEAHPEAHPEAKRGGGAGATELYRERGRARAQAGQTEGAVADIGRVIAAARAAGDRAGIRDALIQLGMAYRRADDYPRARACLTEALAECRAMGDERRAADTLYHLGTVFWSDCRNREAIACHEEAVSICERLGVADLVAVQAYHGRGEAHFNNLEPARAIACYERSIELARGIGDRSYECENLMMVGYALTGSLGLADYAKAEAMYRAALDIAERADLQWHLGPTRLGLAHVRACTGHYGEAWTGMTQTLHWLESLRLTRYQIMAYDFMARLLLDLDRHAQAIELSQRGVALAREAGITFWRPRIEADLAIASIRLGRLEVEGLLADAARLSRENSEGTQLAPCLEGLAELSLARGDAIRGLGFADELLALAQAGGHKELAAQARRWRGQALAALGEREAAAAELSACAATAQELGRLRLALDAARALHALAPSAGHGARAEAMQARMRESLRGSELFSN